jgi:Zn finger protein HypA/HybF involved in hydrogenase expression
MITPYIRMEKNLRLSAIIDQLLRQSKPMKSVHFVVGELIHFNDLQITQQWNESPLGQIPLTIRRVPVVQQCMTCFEKYQPVRAEVSCPRCGGVGAKIISGEEFYLESFD